MRIFQELNNWLQSYIESRLKELESDIKFFERDKTKIKFCPDDCSFLDPQECYQTQKKENHYCILYDKILKHRGFHPYIIACEECKNISLEPKNVFGK